MDEGAESRFRGRVQMEGAESRWRGRCPGLGAESRFRGGVQVKGGGVQVKEAESR